MREIFQYGLRLEDFPRLHIFRQNLFGSEDEIGSSINRHRFRKGLLWL